MSATTQQSGGALHLSPGMRVQIRDAEWRVRRVDPSSDGGFHLVCDGLSEVVRGREGQFLTKLEDEVRILSPESTELVDDDSPGYQAGLLYLETMLRKTPATGDRIHLGHRAALDTLPYQLDPARQALQQPRQRILIADSVGLGKTLEAGILISELIARGRGKRILVLAVKSMLAQFQQELWNRFTIPLVRLDSTGLQRVRSRIPSNHNPFHYFDRAIISIDTLKQDIEYRHYLEQAYWDIIVIDEAQNVAERGSSSQRARLAKLLAARSETLIMLSATPHDGKPESFASLMNMLDPTAIADPSNYAHQDFRDKGLVIRRFKKDIRDQLSDDFAEREIGIARAAASPPEEAVFDQLQDLSFSALDKSGRAHGGNLFRTTLKKALYSSPAACLSTIENRIQRLQRRKEAPEVLEDIDKLNGLHAAVRAITDRQFSKYQLLLEMLGQGDESLGWQPDDPEDRLVIFTESIKSLEFLQERLPKDLKGLKAGQVAVLRGDMPDRELMEVVQQFGQISSPIRLLLCSDVASEGINLHHLSHRLIHFDIPWSLMVFQQRNGRIDRYGQRHQPQIRYLVTESGNARIQGEKRVLEVLIEKDEQAQKNIGDPSEFMGMNSVQEEEEKVAEFMEQQADDLSGLFSAFLDKQASSSQEPLANFLPDAVPSREIDSITAELPSLFESDFAYAAGALDWLRKQGLGLQAEVDRERQKISLTASPDLQARLRFLPNEARPEDDRFILTPDRDLIQQELRLRRDEDSNWASRQFLWPLHLVMEWLEDRVLGAFGRHTAPLFRLSDRMKPNETAFLLLGGYPNRRGYSLVQAWMGFLVRDGEISGEFDLPGIIDRLALEPGKVPNRNRGGETEALQELLKPVCVRAEQRLDEHKRKVEGELHDRLLEQMAAMEQLKNDHIRQLELALEQSDQPDVFKQRRREQGRSQIERVFEEYESWLTDTQLTDDKPYVQVVAAFTGNEAS